MKGRGALSSVRGFKSPTPLKTYERKAKEYPSQADGSLKE